tara:strand:- start:4216 stop:5025 length:810 start_codon:yes stop_codon:yes gene_type:complete
MGMEKTTTQQRSATKRFGLFSALAVGLVLATYILIGISIYFGVKHGWLIQRWNTLGGDGQANVLAAIITSLGLLSSAIVLPFIFKDRISSLSDMVDRTEHDLKQLSVATNEKLDELTRGFECQLAEFQEQSARKADEGQELVVGLYAAVTTLLGQGHITDSAHARQIVHGLWEQVKPACRDKLENRKYLRQTTTDEINSLRSMSDDQLLALEKNNIISWDDRAMLLKLKRLRYAKSAPAPADFPLIRELQKAVDLFCQGDDTENYGNGK